MLPKTSRLTRSLFTSLNRARLLHSDHFMLRVAEEGARPRVGVSVSKKVAKKAVIRNRTRRRVYSALRPTLPSLPAGIYLLSAKKGTEMLKGESLEHEVAELLKKSYNR